MTTILLARHGETDWNRDRRFQGHADPPLNERGREQARELAHKLAGVEVAAVYTSPLRRARETAEIVAAAAGVELRVEPHLREVDVGDWTALTVDEVQQRFPEQYARWRAHETHGWNGGESYETLGERVVPALLTIGDAHPGATIVAVTHGGPIRAIAGVIAGLDPLATRRTIPVLENCGIAAITVDGGTLRESRWTPPAVYPSSS
ncbi:MAG: histidine phosphatase family protein [Actinomycetota bacterium]|nr:histidine phosphatase family protein [Actinomycetota bacterium]